MKLPSRQPVAASDDFEGVSEKSTEILRHWKGFTSPTQFGETALKPFKKLYQKVLKAEAYKHDLEVVMADLTFTEAGAIEVKNLGRLLVTETAFSQLCARLKIPVDYMEKCPLELRNANIAHWISQHDERKALLRTRLFTKDEVAEHKAAGILRAVLPATYEPIDNARMLDWVATIIERSDGRVGIYSSRISEESTHIRLLFSDVQREMPWDHDQLWFGLHLSDSEVGVRGFAVMFGDVRTANGNGVLYPVEGGALVSQRHIHIDFKLLRREVVETAPTSAREFIETADSLLANAAASEVKDPTSYIRRLMRHYRQTNDFSESVTVAYDAAPHASRYGVAHAFSRAAQRLPIDQRIDIESTVGLYLTEGA